MVYTRCPECYGKAEIYDFELPFCQECNGEAPDHIRCANIIKYGPPPTEGG